MGRGAELPETWAQPLWTTHSALQAHITSGLRPLVLGMSVAPVGIGLQPLLMAGGGTQRFTGVLGLRSLTVGATLCSAVSLQRKLPLGVV